MNQQQLVASDCLTFERTVITVCNTYSNMKNFTFYPQNDSVHFDSQNKQLLFP
jgi:hypothetical protein